MARALKSLLAAVFAALALSGVAHAAGGNYVFDGGTPKQQAGVRNALNASSFDWSLIPAEITIHIKGGVDTEAAPGEIWVDTRVLAAGKFAWGLIQHEMAHQVDFFLLEDAPRATLAEKLGGRSWWASGVVGHGDLGSERFASTLAWAYWPSKANAMRPTSPRSESAAMAPAAFRSLLGRILSSAGKSSASAAALAHP
jgi:hypothetical protein